MVLSIENRGGRSGAVSPEGKQKKHSISLQSPIEPINFNFVQTLSSAIILFPGWPETESIRLQKS